MLHRLFRFDFFLLIATLLLLSIGLIAIYSSTVLVPGGTMRFLGRQIIFAIMGIVLMVTIAFMNYNLLRSWSSALYFMTLGVLIFVLLFGRTVNGTAGWIGVGNVTLQPVEGAKIILIIFLASFISAKSAFLTDTMRVIASCVLSGAVIGLILLQPDFGSAMIIALLWAGLLALSGLRRSVWVTMILLGLVAAFMGWFLLAEYQRDRLRTFFDPTRDAQGSGYNVIQSLVAVGSGGLWGKGIGHGSQSQLNFLPEKHTDFIFAVIVEELGLVGGLTVIGLYAVIFYRLRMIALHAPNNFGYLIVTGVIIVLFVHIFINIGMTIGVMPVTGIPLPLVSYGGSSLLAISAALGIAQSVAVRRRRVVDQWKYTLNEV